jgi:LysM repeat protein/DNA-directed RNA polymerase specialized sigma24 family protein/WD40 repeat protein
MFDHDPKLSPDLVWLLQSQQVEDGLLARTLVREYYAQFQPFWEALLGDSQTARQATREMLIAALLKTNTYHETQSVSSWLTRLAVDFYRKEHLKLGQGYKPTSEKKLHLERLSLNTRLAAVLCFRLNYPPKEVAGFLDEKPASTETRLEAARQLLLDQIGRGNRSAEYQAEEDPLPQAFQGAYPTPALSEVDLELFSQEVIEHASRKRRALQRVAYWKEIAMICAVILVVLVWMTRSNLDAPEATPKPPEARAIAGGMLRPTRRPSATPTAHPTITQYSWLNTYTPTPPQSTPTPIPKDAFYIVQEGDTLWGIAIKLGTSVEELTSLNRLPEEAILQPGQALLKPGSIRLNTPAPTPRHPTPRPTLTPLADPHSADEILRRLNSFNFNSFWVDLQFIYRGPQGYLDEPRTYRVQWWMAPSGMLILAGQSHDTPGQAIKWGRPWSITELYIAQPEFGKPWFESSNYNDILAQLTESLSLVFNIHSDYWKDQWVNTVVAGSSQMGDRQAYLLRQFNSQQQLMRTIWIDKASGLPLHVQIHDPHNPRRITTEVVVSGLEINPDIPLSLFNPQIPWLGGYAKDSSGVPFAPGGDPSLWEITPAPRVIQPYTPAPTFLNLATSPLQFQFGQLYSLFPNPNSQVHYRAEIFAGNKYLGLATLPDPFRALCARSPDGRRIAYSSASISSLDMYSVETAPGKPIRWIDLRIPSMENLLDLEPFSFVFSPNSEQLAVFGERHNANRGIYLVDLQSGESRLLRHVDHATSLAWKPDGTQLAYISRPTGSRSSFSLVVLDVRSGEVVSQQPLPVPVEPPARNDQIWPPLQWGVPFPVGMGDLGDCAAPPK